MPPLDLQYLLKVGATWRKLTFAVTTDKKQVLGSRAAVDTSFVADAVVRLFCIQRILHLLAFCVCVSLLSVLYRNKTPADVGLT